MKKLIFVFPLILTFGCTNDNYYSKRADEALSKASLAQINNDYSRACMYASLAASYALDSKDDKLYRYTLSMEKSYCKK